MSTTFVLSRTFENRLGYPYNTCQNKLEFIPGPKAITNKTTFPYFQSECFSTCRHYKIAEACNRLQDYLENSQYFYTNIRYYYEYVGILYNNCSRGNRTLIRDLNILFLRYGENKICEDICSTECSSIKYSILPLYYYNKDRSTSKVTIYYRSFSSTWIKQIPKFTGESLFGSIGGIFGLFLGSSILTFAELIDFIYTHIWLIIDYKLMKRTPKVLNLNKK